ncbi:unnamed protein product [Chrysoparadoxa australica]
MVETRSSLRRSQGISPEAFHAAARDGDVELLQSFLQRQAPVDMRDDGAATTPLIIASHNGHEACVRVLLDGGADINAAKRSGKTALMYSARRGHLNVLQLLLQRGADVHQKDSNENNALYWACDRGHTKCVAALLDAGTDINGHMMNGFTALMAAALESHLPVLQLLLQRGADVNQTDKQGNNALGAACCRGHAACATVLLDAGASQLNENGYHVLHPASAHGYLDVVEVLLKRGADPDMIGMPDSELNIAQACMFLWKSEHFADVTKFRQKKVLLLLARWSFWNLQWTSKKLSILLRARHNKGEDICAEGSQEESSEVFRDLMVRLIHLSHENEGIFRNVVSYL